MSHTYKLQHLTLRKIFPFQTAPYTIYRHQVDGDHCNNVHDHDFLEMVVITGGRGIHLTPSGDIPIESGAMFVLQPGVWHGYTECEELLVNVLCINMSLFDNELAWLRENVSARYLLWETAMTPTRTAAPVHLLSTPQLIRSSRTFFTLQEVERRQSPQARVQQIGMLTTFLAELADCVTVNQALPNTERQLSGLPFAVEKTLLLFSENIARDWSITELSARFGLSTPYYIRLFNREMCESPLSYLSSMRARRAAQMLMSTNNPISLVGLEVGWPEPGYFARRFRHYFGLSPREYRQKYRDFSHT